MLEGLEGIYHTIRKRDIYRSQFELYGLQLLRHSELITQCGSKSTTATDHRHNKKFLCKEALLVMDL